MFLISPSGLINLFCAIIHWIFANYFYTLFSLLFNISTQEDSCTISLVDKIPAPILSLLSSDVYDDDGDKTEFLMQCRCEYSNDRCTLSKIDEFELNYCPEQAIYWYTRDTFVYRIVNKALRTKNVQMINKSRFFIRDLHRSLSCFHQLEYQRDIVRPSQIYYRGTTLSTEDLDRLVIGKLITCNSFTSFYQNYEVAMMFATNALIQIEINNRTGLYSVFHSISELSHFKDEEEILFSIGNVFRVEEIHWCEKKSLWEVNLILQKHLLYRSNFKVQSTKNTAWKFSEYIWQDLIKPLIEIFKAFALYAFAFKPFFKSITRQT